MANSSDDFLDRIFQPIQKSIDEAITRHHALPPRQKNLARARMGAWILTAEIYTAWLSGPLVAGLFRAFFRMPAAAPAALWVPVAAIAALTLLAAVWLLIGIAGARGPRDPMMIFWSMVRVGIVAGLLAGDVYVPRDDGDWVPATNLVLEILYVAGLAGYGLELVLLIQGPPRMRKHSNAYGQSRLATAAELRRKGIIS